MVVLKLNCSANSSTPRNLKTGMKGDDVMRQRLKELRFDGPERRLQAKHRAGSVGVREISHGGSTKTSHRCRYALNLGDYAK